MKHNKDTDKCTCKEGKCKPHTCPYQEEINDDYKTKCTCCPYCTQQCIDDI